MRVLFLGGTGVISTACTQLAIARGYEVTLLNRSRRPAIPGAQQITIDITDAGATAAAIGNQRGDAVVDFIAYTPAEVEERIALFKGRTRQYVFISTASAYQKPLTHYLITESTPLANPYWIYSRNKIACEDRLVRAYRDEAFPGTIVRPSLTYGETNVPLAVNCWLKSYTAVDRMRQGKAVIVPGDGLSLWTITHNTDFAKGLVGLLGHQGSIGHAFHITSDEAMTWNQIYQFAAEAAGVPTPKLVHMASEFIASCVPDMVGSLLGDKAHSAVFDNTKIKRFVPDFVATTRFQNGIRRSVSWFDAEPARRQIDEASNAIWDRLIFAYERGWEAAKSEFSV